MNRDYLQDYWEKEKIEGKKFEREVLEGRFSLENDIYPPKDRFVNLQKPIALITQLANINNLWCQIPYSGSSILPLLPYPKYLFEEFYFDISEIPRIIEFIKDTGRLQVILYDRPTAY